MPFGESKPKHKLKPHHDKVAAAPEINRRALLALPGGLAQNRAEWADASKPERRLVNDGRLQFRRKNAFRGL